MDNTVSLSLVESLLASRPYYDIAEDCPHTEEISIVAASGAPMSQIIAWFPHVYDCALCKESIQLFMTINDEQVDIQIDEQIDSATLPTLPLPPPARRTRSIVWAVAAIVLIGIAGSLGAYLWHAHTQQAANTTLTPKGAVFDLEIAVSRNGAGFPLQQGEMVETGDQLGFFYSATQSAHLALFHVNHARELSTLFPVSGKQTAFVKDGTRIPIEDGAVVTSSTSCEWIVAIFSQKMMSINQLKTHLNNSIHISQKNGDCDLQIRNTKDMTIRIQQIRK